MHSWKVAAWQLGTFTSSVSPLMSAFMTMSRNRWTIGDVTVTSVVEMEIPIPPDMVLGAATPEHVLAHPWLIPDFATADGDINMRVQLLVIESRGRTIAVDTCIGNDKDRTSPFFDNMSTPFLDTFADAGFDRTTIDTVACTHLHVDHCGWNTTLVDGSWVPTFPNARYLFNAIEVAHWDQYGVHEDGDVFGDSVKPILDAGLADLIAAPYEVTPEVRFVPTPGHSPGHMSIEIESQGQRAFITGDVMHHPLQCAIPDLASNFDSSEDAARAMRRQVLAQKSDTDWLVIGTHFGGAGAGYIKAVGDAWRFDAVPQADLAQRGHRS